MSGAVPPAAKPPKSMSSRLMTMKFMQRAAAATPLPASPSSSTVPSSKRQKTANSPSAHEDAPPLRARNELAAMRAATAAEEAKRLEALERLGNDSGETKWVFSYFEEGREKEGEKGLRVVEWGGDQGGGVSEDGRVDSEPWAEGSGGGRMRFGEWKTAERNPDEDADSDESEDSEEDENEDAEERRSRKSPVDVEAAEKARAKRKVKEKAEKKVLKQLADKRKRKEVNLNERTRISGNGESFASQNMECFGCGERGHMKQDCPKKRPRH